MKSRQIPLLFIALLAAIPLVQAGALEDYSAGVDQFELGNKSQAKKLLESAVSERESLVYAHTLLGLIAYEDEDVEKALDHFQSYLYSQYANPSFKPTVKLYCGRSLFRLHKFRDAAGYFEEAVQHLTDNDFARQELAQTYLHYHDQLVKMSDEDLLVELDASDASLAWPKRDSLLVKAEHHLTMLESSQRIQGPFLGRVKNDLGRTYFQRAVVTPSLRKKALEFGRAAAKFEEARNAGLDSDVVIMNQAAALNRSIEQHKKIGWHFRHSEEEKDADPKKNLRDPKEAALFFEKVVVGVDQVVTLVDLIAQRSPDEGTDQLVNGVKLKAFREDLIDTKDLIQVQLLAAKREATEGNK